MTYATQQDLLDRHGEDELFVAADRDNDDVLDGEAIDAALVDASADIDAWSIHCKEPWGDAQLRAWACDVAMYRLSVNYGPYTEQKKDLADRVRKTIERACPAPKETDSQSGSVAGGVMMVSGHRKFTRRIL